MQQQSAIEIFYCYAHKDKELLEKLKSHLSPLQKQNVIDGWDDSEIKGGIDWKQEIDKRLSKAKIILMLVSSDFLASDDCNKQMQRAQERYEKKETRIIPILLHPCHWKLSPFLGKLKPLPTNRQPVTEWPNPDAAFLDIVQGIHQVINELPPAQSRQPEPEAFSETPEDKKLIQSYLYWMIEQHSDLELRGLGGEDVRLPTLPLEKVYVALKAKRISTYEREQSQELLNANVSDYIADYIAKNEGELSASTLAELKLRAEQQEIVRDPYTLMERDRSGASAGDEILTLGDAFCTERWMVILGDPGSGKTTLARWIALKLASAWLAEAESVIVPAYQVNPNIDKSNKEPINIGLTRLPVLLRVSEFSEACQNKERDFSSIINFLGYHSWFRQLPNLSQKKLNAVIKQYLRSGNVVVILDGMDEITDEVQRSDMVRSIETFINDWINAEDKILSPQEKSELWDPSKRGEPAKKGGNQIIITSRIAGYNVAPITRGPVTHMIIQPMEQPAVEHFCDAWTLAIHQPLNTTDETLQQKAKQKAETEACGLKKAIFDPLHPRIRELASNPLLVTILALVYRNNQRRLPEQRTELYDKALEILVETWRSSSTGRKTVEPKITTADLIDVLSPLAAYIHEHYSTGLIDQRKMRTIIKKALAISREIDVDNPPRTFSQDVDNFIRRIQEEVGILSERSKGTYGFLHLTFQEYLAALDLIGDKKHAPQAIIKKLDDPRWREPILMALGHISIDDDWGLDEQENLLTKLLKADDGAPIPRSALLITAAIPEMAYHLEQKVVVQEIIHRLLAAYADQDGFGRFAISRGLKNLYNSKHQSLLEHLLVNALLAIEKGNKNLALASASLLAEHEWHEWRSTSLLDAFLKASSYDDPAWGYPITRTLHAIATLPTEVAIIPIKSEMSESDQQKLAQLEKSIDSGTLPLRKALEKEPELVAYIESDLSWFCLIVLLYGGISDHGLATYVMQHDEIAAVFYLEKALRTRYIARLRERAYWKESWDKDDVVHNLAVHLDTENGKILDAALQYIPRFTSLAILNDSPLTDLLLKTLRQKTPPLTLKEHLWQEWYTASQEICRVHALLALLVIDTREAIKALTQSFEDTATYALAELVLNQLRVRKHTLKGAILLLGKREEIGASLQPLQATLPDDQWGDLVELFFRTFTSVTPLPVKYDEVLLARSRSLPRLNAEIWAYWLSGFGGDDPSYSYAIILDTLGKELQSASALINIQHAYNSHYPHDGQYPQLMHWRSLLIPPEYDNYADIVGEALTIAHQSRSEVMKTLFYVGTMTFAWINYPEYPGLKEDALAAALLIPLEFQEEIIKDLDAELSESPTYDVTIIERVMSIADPVIRARALWRIAHYHREWNNHNLWDLSIKAAEQISDSLQRSRAFERLISSNDIPPQQREELKHKALDAASNISDPNNRARALARLALYESSKKRWSLLDDALAAIQEMTNEQQKIDTLRLLHPYLVENNTLSQRYDDIVKDIKSEWYQHKGKNLLAIHLVDHHAQLHEPQKLTPVVLASLIDELVNLKPQKAKNEALWSQLLDATKRDDAISALLKAASANGLDGLYLTPNVFHIIASLLDTKEIAAIYTLLPYLKGAESSLLPSLNDWVKKQPDKMDKRVWAYAGLLLAEISKKVDSDTLPCLIELIENGVDFGRYRASLVLHGSAIFVQKKNRDFRTSQLGEEALLLLAKAHKRLLAEKKALVAFPISYAWHNMRHDDSSLLQKFIHHSDVWEGNEGGVSSLLGNISDCDSKCLDALVNQLAECSEQAQKLLLSTLLDLQTHHSFTSTQKGRIEEALKKFPKSTLENIMIIPERLKTIADLLCSVSKPVQEREITLQAAITVLNEKLSALSLRLPDAQIDELADHRLYDLEYDPKKAHDAAQIVSDNGIALELLFTWLATNLRENIDDSPPDYCCTSTLLELAGATTSFSPAAVYNLCEKNKLGEKLVQAVMHHQTFYGRAGAAILLGYLRKTPDLFNKALLSGLRDVAEVQIAIVQMAQHLQYLDEEMIPQTISLLENESASVVYATAKLLASIVQSGNIQLPPHRRQEIVRALKDIFQQRDSSRPVFILERTEAEVFISAIGRLDQQLYGAIIDIISIV